MLFKKIFLPLAVFSSFVQAGWCGTGLPLPEANHYSDFIQKYHEESIAARYCKNNPEDNDCKMLSEHVGKLLRRKEIYRTINDSQKHFKNSEGYEVYVTKLKSELQKIGVRSSDEEQQIIRAAFDRISLKYIHLVSARQLLSDLKNNQDAMSMINKEFYLYDQEKNFLVWFLAAHANDFERDKEEKLIMESILSKPQ